MNGTIFTPGGKIWSFISFTFASSPLSAASASAPFRIGTTPDDHVVVVDDLSILTANRPCELAEPDLRTLRNHGNIFYAYRRSGLGQNDRVLDIA